MGTIYKAFDRLTQRPVALKTMSETAGVASRWQREADVLAELRHPSIVRYVAHGAAPECAYIAMEWLEGKDLAQRLAQTSMSLDETMSVLTNIADALAYAHARGVVHRDLKPSNIFLVEGSAADVRLLDFGVARVGTKLAQQDITATGIILGTPGYLAPEQARGAKRVDARADVYSLGCVLFKCVTGRAPFTADNLVALLAKILFEDAPRASELCDVPEVLDDFVARLLAKDALARPADGSALGAELKSLRAQLSGAPSSRIMSPPAALTIEEQRLVSVVLVASPHEEGPLSARAATLAEAERPTSVGDHAKQERFDRLRSVALAHGAQLESLLDGSMVAIIGQGATERGGAATDMLVRAARCALALHALSPEVPMALATGRAELTARLPVGQVTERAVALLAREAGIRLDDVSAGLLDMRFEIRGDARGLELRRERERRDVSRTLLGRPTPFVGRERELGTLRSIFDECVAEPVARCVLVTGPAGIGKSRLANELTAKLAREGALIWTGQGDPVSRGSALGLITPSLLRAAGLQEGEPPEARRRKLAARVARNVAEDKRARVSAFLGVCIGAEFPDEATPELAMARTDAVVMGDQIRSAWQDFLLAETKVQPVVLVLDALQWGDVSSIKLIDLALRNLRERPWMLLALARPEVRETHDLWKDRDVQEIRLGELTRRSSEKLVRSVLTNVSDEGVTTMVERAAGNAFYLEEIVRAFAEGRSAETLPDTVLAMVQTRLDVLDVELRRLLRAASVFGERFWGGGVDALLGSSDSRNVLEARLEDLCAREIIDRSGEEKFPGEKEYAFRHMAVRDAAYAMLTESDRTLGHRLAAEWLSRAGEREPIVLAEHWEKGGELTKATDHYLAAAEQALGGNDFAASLEHAARGIKCRASGVKLGALRAVEAEAYKWRGQYAEMKSSANDAVGALAEGTDAWYGAIALLAVANGTLGDGEGLVAAATRVLHVIPTTAAQVAAFDRISAHCAITGHVDVARELWRALDEAKVDSIWLHRSAAQRALFDGDSAGYAEHSVQAADAFERAGDLRNACLQRSNAGDAMRLLGDNEAAESILRKARSDAERMGLRYPATAAKLNLALTLVRIGKPQEAIETARLAAAEAAQQSHLRFRVAASVFLSSILRQANEVPASLEEGSRATKLARDGLPTWTAYALANEAASLLQSGRAKEALELAREAMGHIDAAESLEWMEEGEALVRLAFAEALHACGQFAAARDAIAKARDALLARTDKLRVARYRKTFLEGVPEHARTMALAERW